MGLTSPFVYKQSGDRNRVSQMWDGPGSPHAVAATTSYVDQVRDTESTVSTSWGTFVRTARLSKGVNQDDLAEQINVDRKTLMRIENGETKRVDLELLFQICGALGIRPSEAVASLAPEAERIPLPPPLPTEISRLVDNLNAIDTADRGALLERVAWVNEWVELLMRQRQERHANRQHG